MEKAGTALIVIYNRLGQQVRMLLNKILSAGMHEVVWDGKDRHGTVLPSGLYFCRIETPNYCQTLKLLITK